MPTYEQIPIRLALSLISAPPVSPIDANTGEAPEMWRAQNVAMQLGIFDAGGVPVDLSNLTFLQVCLMQAFDSITPLVTKTIAKINITPIIDKGAWDDGTAQQAIANFTAAELDVGLDAAESKTFWLVIQGQTDAGNLIVYGAGSIEIFNAGSRVPQPPFNYVSENDQANAGGNTTVAPASQFHTEEIVFTGGAGTRNIIVGAAGLVAGAQVTILALFPAVAGIIVQVWNQDMTGSPLFVVATDTFLRTANFTLLFKGGNLQALRADVPAY